MLFSQPVFLFGFLPVLLLLYFLCPKKIRNVLLLMASLWFYAWGEPSLVLLMLLSTVMNYWFGRWVDVCRDRSAAKCVVVLAVTLNLGILIYFKYASFLIESLNLLLAFIDIPALDSPNVTLPIGISFYTFQAMSYVIDVYRGQAQSERNPINVALYIALFPQLIAGPIVRYTDVAAEIKNRSIDSDGFAYGIQRFIVGLGKKMLIANSAASVADAIFDIPDSQLSFAVAWLGILCYTVQIYFDFSGYSDMAIGLGRMFGFRFLENFNYPYVAQSITEFWRRWHISLSSWYRDYLYIPLGGNRCAGWRVSLNLMIVFVLCGLWHGASWNFAFWGIYHGAFLMLERWGLGRTIERLWKPLRHLYTLLVVMGGWVLFRTLTLAHCSAYFKALGGFGAAANPKYPVSLYLDRGLILVLVAAIIGSLPLIPWIVSRLEAFQQQERNTLAFTAVFFASATLRLSCLTLLFLASAAVMSAGTHNPFIYFRF
ncbi:MAG: MBOAT family protein [Planctomycetaceae bacterium]|nr:MBOAT family protein [Planctomycetaceae bacterium]